MDQKLVCSWPGSGISVGVHFCCWKDLKPQIVVWFPWKHIVDRLSLSKHSLPLVTRCAGKETLEALQVSSSGKQQLFHLYCGLLTELMWPIRSQDLKFVSPDWSVELKVDRNSYINQRIPRQCSMSWQSVSPQVITGCMGALGTHSASQKTVVMGTNLNYICILVTSLL